MGKIFNYDGPIMKIGNQIASLMWLNILTLLCCIPVITVGASLTAMHYVLLKISNDEDPKVTECFFKALKDNIKKSTQIWLLFLILILLIGFDFFVMYSKTIKLPVVIQVLLVGIAIILLIIVEWTFILQSRYENSNRRTVKNAFLIAIRYPVCSLAILVSSAIPPILLLLVPRIMPLTFTFWFTLPGFLQVKRYRKVFDKLEAKM